MSVKMPNQSRSQLIRFLSGDPSDAQLWEYVCGVSQLSDAEKFLFFTLLQMYVEDLRCKNLSSLAIDGIKDKNEMILSMIRQIKDRTDGQDSISATIDVINETVQSISDDISILDTKVDGVNHDMADINARVHDSSTIITEVDGGVHNLTKQVTDCIEKITLHDTSISASINNIEKHCLDTYNGVCQGNQNSVKIQSLIDDCKNKIGLMEQQVNSLRENVLSLNQTMLPLSGQIMQSTKDVNAAKDEFVKICNDQTENIDMFYSDYSQFLTNLTMVVKNLETYGKYSVQVSTEVQDLIKAASTIYGQNQTIYSEINDLESRTIENIKTVSTLVELFQKHVTELSKLSLKFTEVDTSDKVINYARAIDIALSNIKNIAKKEVTHGRQL